MSCSDLNVFISGPGLPCVFWNHKPSLKLSSTWNWHPESVIQTAEETATKLVIQEILALFLDPTSHYYSYLRCIWWIWIVRWGLPVVTRKTSSGGIDVDEAMNWKRRHFVKVNHVHYVLGSRLQDEHPEFIHAFNAYTPPGDVTGDLVFVPSSWKVSLNNHEVILDTVLLLEMFLLSGMSTMGGSRISRSWRSLGSALKAGLQFQGKTRTWKIPQIFDLR